MSSLGKIEIFSINHGYRQVYRFTRITTLFSTRKTRKDLHQWSSNKSLVPFEKMAISPYFSTGSLPIAHPLRGIYLTTATGLNISMSSHLCLNCNLYTRIMIKILKIHYQTLLFLCDLFVSSVLLISFGLFFPTI